MFYVRIDIQGLSNAMLDAIVGILEQIGVSYDPVPGSHILVKTTEPEQMTRLTSFLLANPIQYVFVSPNLVRSPEDYPSYGVTLPAISVEEALLQVQKPWSQQRDPVSYLRKLMVEIFGLSRENPIEVDELWLKGYTPPKPPVA